MRSRFASARPVLLFVATVAERGTTDDEQLRSPADLARWLREAGLTAPRAGADAGLLASALALREAMYRLLTARVGGLPPRAGDRALVNGWAARPRTALQLRPDGSTSRRGGTDRALADLAHDCLDLAGGPDLDRLRRCAGERCTRLFVDTSRGRTRRWCDMKGCGDRAKAAAYRGRRRADRPGYPAGQS